MWLRCTLTLPSSGLYPSSPMLSLASCQQHFWHLLQIWLMFRIITHFIWSRGYFRACPFIEHNRSFRNFPHRTIAVLWPFVAVTLALKDTVEGERESERERERWRAREAKINALIVYVSNVADAAAAVILVVVVFFVCGYFFIGFYWW